MRKLLKLTAENYSFTAVVEDIRKYLNKKTHDNFIDMKRSYLLFLDKATLCTPYYQHVIEICNFSVDNEETLRKLEKCQSKEDIFEVIKEVFSTIEESYLQTH